MKKRTLALLLSLALAALLAACAQDPPASGEDTTAAPLAPVTEEKAGADTTVTPVAGTASPETEKTPETAAPGTEAVTAAVTDRADTTAAPPAGTESRPAASDTAPAPSTVRADETDAAPETTKAPETAKTPGTTDAPVTTAEPLAPSSGKEGTEIDAGALDGWD